MPRRPTPGRPGPRPLALLGCQEIGHRNRSRRPQIGQLAFERCDLLAEVRHLRVVARVGEQLPVERSSCEHELVFERRRLVARRALQIGDLRALLLGQVQRGGTEP
jgi:hypothetical protein